MVNNHKELIRGKHSKLDEIFEGRNEDGILVVQPVQNISISHGKNLT